MDRTDKWTGNYNKVQLRVQWHKYKRSEWPRILAFRDSFPENGTLKLSFKGEQDKPKVGGKSSKQMAWHEQMPRREKKKNMRWREEGKRKVTLRCSGDWPTGYGGLSFLSLCSKKQHSWSNPSLGSLWNPLKCLNETLLTNFYKVLQPTLEGACRRVVKHWVRWCRPRPKLL